MNEQSPDWSFEFGGDVVSRTSDPRLAITKAALQGIIRQFKPMAKTMDAIEETVRSMHREGVPRAELLALGYSETALDKVLTGGSIIDWPYR